LQQLTKCVDLGGRRYGYSMAATSSVQLALRIMDHVNETSCLFSEGIYVGQAVEGDVVVAEVFG
jgi:hypothetical protein